MKEYGKDLLLLYKKNQKELKSLDKKVRKRCNFLMKKIKPSSYIWRKYHNMDLDECSIKYVLNAICEIEVAYVDQTKQGELFSI